MTEKFKNLHIQFNKNIIQKLKSFNLDVDYLGSSLFILFALDEQRYDLLNEFDDDNKARRAIILYRQLERREFLKKCSKESNYLYELTEKAKSIIQFIKSEFEKKQHSEVSTESFNIVMEEETVASWVKEYLLLFPSGKHYGRYLRTHSKDVIERLQKFMKTYGYEKNTILKATAKYIKENENSEKGHEFTRNSSYFIFKEGQSDLAFWCEKVQNEKEDSKLDTSFMDTI